MFSVKLQTVVTFPLVFEIGQIIYRFEIELNFLAMPTMVVCNSFCSEKVVYDFGKTSNGHNFSSSYRNKANFISIWDRIEFSLQCVVW